MEDAENPKQSRLSLKNVNKMMNTKNVFFSILFLIVFSVSCKKDLVDIPGATDLFDTEEALQMLKS